MGVDETRFWRIVGDTRLDADGDIRLQAELLADVLGELDPDEVLSFRRHLVAAHRRAYSHQMLQAADLMLHGVSDDQYTGFRTWLVCHGWETFEAAVADPDSIADLPLDDRTQREVGAAEWFAGVADEVYTDLTGDEIPVDEDVLELLGELDGAPFDEAALPTALPRLYAHRHG